MEGHDFLTALGRQLTRELTEHEEIRYFVGEHPSLIGAYAEASLRRFIARVVAPLQVSTGTIIYEGNISNKPPQLDAIIWSPTPVPAIFENAGFAVVPRGSAHGFIEIKSSSYTGTGRAIAKMLAYDEELIQPRAENYIGALGVVCIEQKPDKTLLDLVEQKRAVIMLKRKGNSLLPNPEGIWTLVNYLTKLRLRAKGTEGQWLVNFPFIDTAPTRPKVEPS